MTISKLRKHRLRVDDQHFAALFDPVEARPVYVQHGYLPNDIRYYIANGQDFRPVCRVKPDSRPSKLNNHSWEYVDIDQSIMYSNENHWVYAITVDHEIVKWGESHNPLGIRVNSQYNYDEPQPQHGTTSRLGRYRSQGKDTRDTDYTIRQALLPYVQNPNHKVEFWARKCIEYREVMMIEGFRKTLVASNNKYVEKFLLDFYKHIYGHHPRLNKARA